MSLTNTPISATLDGKPVDIVGNVISPFSYQVAPKTWISKTGETEVRKQLNFDGKLVETRISGGRGTTPGMKFHMYFKAEGKLAGDGRQEWMRLPKEVFDILIADKSKVLVVKKVVKAEAPAEQPKADKKTEKAKA